MIKFKCVGSLDHADLECRVARQARPAVAKVLAGKSAIGVLGPYFMNDADYAAFNAK